ncbi:hypothetical protein PoB_006473700 [Plakobranchus ocellatus]|uniref:Uncharacterized protein n=1 Tax=Plakobranchus ocellatus TaxID=259542 RepID=A0AAV4D239_9GAST|nr:hypothetical protein PoB_006473700 [Plakobranchus ocellatus]
MVSVMFTKGSQKLKYKNDFCSDLIEVQFLPSTFELQEEPQRTTPRGFPPQKKQEIITNLFSLTLGTRHAFWNNLPESIVKDLAIQHEKRASL